jgi:hypothetical protein
LLTAVGIVGEVLRFGGGYLPAFALTWLIETIVYLAAFRALGFVGSGRESRLTIGRAVLLVLAVNLVSHPLLWWFASSVDHVGAVLLGELAVVGLEGSILALVLRGGWRWSLLAAVLANAVSFLVGLLWLGPILSVAGFAACC